MIHEKQAPDFHTFIISSDINRFSKIFQSPHQRWTWSTLTITP